MNCPSLHPRKCTGSLRVVNREMTTVREGTQPFYKASYVVHRPVDAECDCCHKRFTRAFLANEGINIDKIK